MMSAFHIPSDNDDSGLNIELGSTLFKLQDKFPNLFDKWLKKNYNY